MASSNEAIKLVDTTEHLTARCPAMCMDKTSADKLLLCVTAVNQVIHQVLDSIKGMLFEPLTMKTSRGTRKITVFDIYCFGLPRKYEDSDGHEVNCLWEVGDPDSSDGKKKEMFIVMRGRKQYLLNASTGLYPTRSLFQANLPGSRQALLDVISESFSKAFGKPVEKVSVLFRDCVCEKVDSMLKGYARRVSRLSRPAVAKHPDTKWKTALCKTANDIKLDSVEAKKLIKILDDCLPQTDRAVNGELPDARCFFGEKLDKEVKRTIDNETWKLTYEVSFLRCEKQVKKLYRGAYKEFCSLVLENFPIPKKLIPVTFQGMTVDKMETVGNKYFDRVVKLQMPGGSIPLLIRIHSGKGTNYYPDDLFAMTSGCPKPTLVIKRNDVKGRDMICGGAAIPVDIPMTLNIPYERPISVPNFSKDDAEKVSLSTTVGIDAGYAVAALTTTISSKNIGPDMMDWHEAVYAYHKERPNTNLFTRTASGTCRDDLMRLCNEYKSGNYNLICLLTVALREGAPVDAEHDWEPVCDPCAPMFSWLQNRKKKNGKPFYNEKQLSIIGHTKVWRRHIRELLANRIHYFNEQSIWDTVHDTINDVFVNNSPIASALSDAYATINNAIRQETTYLLSYELLNTEYMKTVDIVSMEELNLNDLKENTKCRSLYDTLTKDWCMNSEECRVHVSKHGQVAVVDFGRKVTTKEVLGLCKETKDWLVPYKVKIKGTEATLYCELTEEGALRRRKGLVESYMHRALHLALLKRDIERILRRRKILFRGVDAENTSKTCHACGYAKCPTSGNDRKNKKNSNTNKTNVPQTDTKKKEYTLEECQLHKYNYRNGRVFVCGNPECTMCGVEQNADTNAAYCIRNRVKYANKDFPKALKET